LDHRPRRRHAPHVGRVMGRALRDPGGRREERVGPRPY
jgi:hypothetical protein